jgi:hypothetical protein
MKVRTRYPGWLPTLAAVIGLAVTLSAAYWQFGRAAYKEQLQHEFRLRQEAPPVVVETANALPDTEIALRKVTVTGRYLAEHTIYLDNRLRDGIAGYEVVTPLSTGTAAAVVLVNRGWIRAAAERNVLPQVDTPAGPVTVTGTAVVPSGRILELSDQTVAEPRASPVPGNASSGRHELCDPAGGCAGRRTRPALGRARIWRADAPELRCSVAYLCNSDHHLLCLLRIPQKRQRRTPVAVTARCG